MFSPFFLFRRLYPSLQMIVKTRLMPTLTSEKFSDSKKVIAPVLSQIFCSSIDQSARMARYRNIRLGIVLSILFLLASLLFFSCNDMGEFLMVQSNADFGVFPLWKTNRLQPFSCPIQGERWIVVTTIFYPTPAIYKFLDLSSPWNLVVIADRKTPVDWLQHLKSNSSRVLFVSVEQQKTLNYRILELLPYGSYARKNLGYLIAIQCGARIIFESDDDNLLETNDIVRLPKMAQPKDVPWVAFHRQRSPLVNIYGSFGHPEIWPRGFPIDELRNVTEDGWHSVRKNRQPEIRAYIQQYLADLDPDVDALVRFSSIVDESHFLLSLSVPFDASVVHWSHQVRSKAAAHCPATLHFLAVQHPEYRDVLRSFLGSLPTRHHHLSCLRYLAWLLGSTSPMGYRWFSHFRHRNGETSPKQSFLSKGHAGRGSIVSSIGFVRSFPLVLVVIAPVIGRANRSARSRYCSCWILAMERSGYYRCMAG